MKRFLSLLLVLCMLVGMLPMTVLAEGADPTETSTLTFKTKASTESTAVTWSPKLAPGMAPVYAKTLEDGTTTTEGASESDWNIKVEWALDGDPTLTLWNAYLVNELRARTHTINISGSADFVILLKGENKYYGNPTGTTTAASYGQGIFASNKGTLTIRSLDKTTDSMYFEVKGAAMISKQYNELILENANIVGKLLNTGSNNQCGISMQYVSAGYEDKTNLKVIGSKLDIEGTGNYYSVRAISLGGNTTSNDAANTGDILFRNSEVRLYRSNSTGTTNTETALIWFGANSTLTFDRCDVLIYGRHITLSRVPTILNGSATMTPESGSQTALPNATNTVGSALGKSTKFQMTHDCSVDSDCTVSGICEMCGSEVIAAQEHVASADDGDCTTPIYCGNRGCQHIVVAGAVAHTPAADDNDCSTDTPCAVCTKIAVPAPGHTPGSRASCTDIAYCTVCGKAALQPTSHIGGTATCIAQANCSRCGVAYGPLSGHTGGLATCLAKAVCSVCGQAYGEIGTHIGGTATCTERAICDTCAQPYGEPRNHTYSNIEDVSCNAEGCTYTREVPQIVVQVNTGTNSALLSWAPELSEGMEPAYAKTTAEGLITTIGVSASDYNLKVEWPVGGTPTLTLQNATLANDCYYQETPKVNCPETIMVSGVEDFLILVKGTNVIKGRHDTKPTTTAAYRSPTGIEAKNEGTLTIKGDSKADSLYIDNYSGNILSKWYNALTIENVTVTGQMHNVSSNAQFGIVMNYGAAGNEDKTDLTVRNANLTIEGGRNHANLLIVMCGEKEANYSASNTGDILFKNSNIRLYRNNSTSSSQDATTIVRSGPNSIFTIDRCDVYIYSRSRTLQYWPNMTNVAVVSAGSGTWEPGDAISGSALSVLELTHICGTDAVGGERICDVCDQSIHVPAEDDGDCTTAVVCAVCGEEVIAAQTHTFSDMHDVDCNNAGCTYTRITGVANGMCGANLYWTLESDGTLTISGTGPMEDYSGPATPWDNRSVYVKTVVIEDGVTSIGDYAFSYCGGLTSVTFGNSVTSIGDCAFSHCGGLTSVTIGNRVTSIGDYAFEACDGLTAVTIPASVTHMGWRVFDECENLMNVSFQEGFINVDGAIDLIVGYGYSITIPTTAQNVGFGVYDSNVVMFYRGTKEQADAACIDINYPDYEELVWHYEVIDVVVNGEAGYYCPECNSFYRLDGTEMVTNLAASGTCGDHLMWYLDQTGTLTISGTGAMYDYQYGSSVPWYEDRASVKVVVIENGVTTVGDCAFYECAELTNVTIPDSVTTIGDWAFAYCYALAEIEIPNGVTSIGDGAFTFTVISSIVIPDSVTTIGESVFSACYNLSNVTLPKGITSISAGMFNGCSSLTEFTIPNTVTTIGTGAFGGCSGLTSISIPNTVTSIESLTFEGCRSLVSVTIPDSVTAIGDYAFYDCNSLTSVTIPDSVTTIGDYAFCFCSNLTKVIYCGTWAQWDVIDIDGFNEPLTDATLQLHNYENCVCTICGAMGAHTAGSAVVENIIAADCVNAGRYDSVTYCTDCGQEMSRVAVVEPAALGHDLVIHNAQAPTCTEIGWDAYETCSRCTHTTYAEQAALGHDYQHGVCTRCSQLDPGYVAGEYDPQIFVESKRVVKGSTFTVNVWIKNNPGFAYLELTPDFAPELTLVQVENGTLISDLTIGKQYLWVANQNVTADGILLTLTFLAEDDIAAGNYRVGFTLRTCCDDEEVHIPLYMVAGDIQVIDCPYGDVNGDGVVDGFDVIRLIKYLADYNYDTNTSAFEIFAGADANGNGVVDGMDVLRLKKYLANFNYDTGISTVPLGPQ